MSCKTDVKYAIIKNIMKKFTEGKPTFQTLSEDTVAVTGTSTNRLSRAKKDSQARAIADNLARRVAEYTNKHVMGYVSRKSEYDPYTVTFFVSPAYIEQEYKKLPTSQQTDPNDKPETGMPLEPVDLPPIKMEC